jgi:hypothetical protein
MHRLWSLIKKVKGIAMENDVYLKINEPQVVHETIDGETIVLNLEKGLYYSLNDTGSLLWSLIENKCPKKEIVKEITRLFVDDEDHLKKQFETFLDSLIQEGLVVFSENVESFDRNDGFKSNLKVPAPNPPRFISPELIKHTDMKDLLLLDPIHDVDDSGWPAAKAN